MPHVVTAVGYRGHSRLGLRRIWGSRSAWFSARMNWIQYPISQVCGVSPVDTDRNRSPQCATSSGYSTSGILLQPGKLLRTDPLPCSNPKSHARIQRLRVQGLTARNCREYRGRGPENGEEIQDHRFLSSNLVLANNQMVMPQYTIQPEGKKAFKVSKKAISFRCSK